jgi:gamma-butyrobetaine dioxygenase
MRSDLLTGSTIAHVALDDRHVRVVWTDESVSMFHHVWLRDNSPQRRHPETGHRVEETSAISPDVRPVDVMIDGEGRLQIDWGPDDHISLFEPDWLRRHDYSNNVRLEPPTVTLWDASVGAALPRADYPTVLADADARRRFLRGFCAYGLAILTDVPIEPGTVLDVAKLFGEVRSTSWGTVFDVVSKPNANSVAYTNLPLVVHTDEAYRDPVPTVQLQHFLESEASGGASTLTDGFKVASDIRATRPDLFELLATVPIHFHFRDATSEHEHQSSVLDVDPSGRLRSVRYSNHSAQPFLIDPALMDDFYEAYRLFGQMRESDRYRLQIEMGPGELYMVDNRRVMHGRTGFTADGPRHLQSCYIERDELVSRLRVLERGR